VCFEIFVHGTGFEAQEGKKVVVNPQGMLPADLTFYPTSTSVRQSAIEFKYYRITPLNHDPTPPIDFFIDANGNGSCASPETRWTIAGFAGGTCGVCQEVWVTPASAIGATASACP
jgi:hypothetical protein